MGSARTLLNMLNVSPHPKPFSQSALIIVDAQKEYVDGVLPLYKIEEALLQLKELLLRARKLGVPIYHMVHHALPGAPIFNPDGQFVQIADPVQPIDGEAVIVKHHPSSFVETNLQEWLEKSRRKDLIIAGFMTHMCINATARSASDLGFSPTIVASACTTRDLPGLGGSVISAQQVHNSNLASLADLVASVVATPADIHD